MDLTYGPRFSIIEKFANINLPLFFYRRHGRNMTERASLIQDARRRIKLDAIEDQLEKFRPISLVIPCRENYDFRKDVWDASFMQSTLLRLCLSKFISSKLADHIIVACDNEAVQDILAEFEDERILFHLRQKEETFRSAPLAPSLTKALDEIRPRCNRHHLGNILPSPIRFDRRRLRKH